MPSTPPNLPRWTSPAGNNGASVTPASDVTTKKPSVTSKLASSRASLVPPKMRMRLAGMRDDFTAAAHNDDVRSNRRTAKHLHRNLLGLPCNIIRDRDAPP